MKAYRCGGFSCYNQCSTNYLENAADKQFFNPIILTHFTFRMYK